MYFAGVKGDVGFLRLPCSPVCTRSSIETVLLQSCCVHRDLALFYEMSVKPVEQHHGFSWCHVRAVSLMCTFGLTEEIVLRMSFLGNQ